MPATTNPPRWARPVAALAFAFGLLTLKSGGGVLFFEGPRLAVGNYVPFVVWFNFLTGFAYVAAAIGLWRWERWAARLAAAITVLTLLVFAAFGLHVLTGGDFEMRTVGAMTLRLGFWAVIAVASCRALGCLGKRAATG